MFVFLVVRLVLILWVEVGMEVLKLISIVFLWMFFRIFLLL